MMNAREWHIALIAGEPSGDHLGAALMAALTRQAERQGVTLRFSGIGGDEMTAGGLVSLYPLSDIAVMGLGAIAAKLPLLYRRVKQAVRHYTAAPPDLLVIIDSPEFTHPIAKRIKKAHPKLPVLDYVSPSVWAWRPWRARKMARYIDHVLALLPFEPEAHRRLGGPACSYVGHPLIEKRDWINSLDVDGFRQAPGADDAGREPLVVLPGSRSSEVRHLMPVFGQCLALLRARGHDLEVLIPVREHVRPQIEAAVADWPVAPRLLSGEADKYRAFRTAKAALAASGTVTLELALTKTPMIVGYKMDRLTEVLRPLINVPSIVLPNLVLERNIIPEYIQQDCAAGQLVDGLVPLLQDGSPERQAQLAGFDEIADRMQVAADSPGAAAAAIVFRHLQGYDQAAPSV